jgi:hypothetical protein
MMAACPSTNRAQTGSGEPQAVDGTSIGPNTSILIGPYGEPVLALGSSDGAIKAAFGDACSDYIPPPRAHSGDAESLGPRTRGQS